MKRFMIGVAAMLLAGACAYVQDLYENDRDYASGAEPYEKVNFAGEIATAEERARCEAAGGVVRRDGMRGWQQCIQAYADAGKACTDSDDCLGQCRADLGEAGVTATGTCQANDSPFGCHAVVEDGKVQPAICVD